MFATGLDRIMAWTIIALKNHDTLRDKLFAVCHCPREALGVDTLPEVYGRNPVLHASNGIFIVTKIAHGFTNNKKTLNTSR
jgi:hypothetical protein